MSTNKLVINYCLNNVSSEVRQQLNSLEQLTVEDFCLQRCGDCFAGPFLIVNGNPITGESHAQIIQELSGRSQNP